MSNTCVYFVHTYIFTIIQFILFFSDASSKTKIDYNDRKYTHHDRYYTTTAEFLTGQARQPRTPTSKKTQQKLNSSNLTTNWHTEYSWALVCCLITLVYSILGHILLYD